MEVETNMQMCFSQKKCAAGSPFFKMVAPRIVRELGSFAMFRMVFLRRYLFPVKVILLSHRNCGWGDKQI